VAATGELLRGGARIRNIGGRGTGESRAGRRGRTDERPGFAALESRIISQADGRGLVVGIHDGGGDRSETLAALPTVINTLRSRGYTFVKLCADV
jgi:peptidoglycan/xylan/chitin deacetylase (PgdA/CDA1 family)